VSDDGKVIVTAILWPTVAINSYRNCLTCRGHLKVDGKPFDTR